MSACTIQEHAITDSSSLGFVAHSRALSQTWQSGAGHLYAYSDCIHVMHCASEGECIKELISCSTFVDRERENHHLKGVWELWKRALRMQFHLTPPSIFPRDGLSHLSGIVRVFASLKGTRVRLHQ